MYHIHWENIRIFCGKWKITFGFERHGWVVVVLTLGITLGINDIDGAYFSPVKNHVIHELFI